MHERPTTAEPKSGGHRRPRPVAILLLVATALLVAHAAILHQLLAKTADWPHVLWIAVAAGAAILVTIKHRLWRQWKIRKDGS